MLVKKVDFFVKSSTTVVRVIYEPIAGDSASVAPAFSCVPNTTSIGNGLYQASAWNGSTTSSHQIMVAQLLAAQAQGIPVDLYFTSSGCNEDTSFGYLGLGREMKGVSVSDE